MIRHRKLLVESLAPLGSNGAVSFVSATRSEGTTTSAVSMANTLSRYLNYKVLLVDGNFSAPFLHRTVGLSAGPGLSDLFLVPSVPIDQFIRREGLPFDVITAGNATDRAAKAMSPHALDALLKVLRTKYTYVLFDLGAADGSPIPTVIAPLFDGVVLVINSGATRWEVAQNLRDKLQAAQANILGVILNKRRFSVPRFLYNRL